MDLAKFFDVVRTEPFDGSLTQGQVNGLTSMLNCAQQINVPSVQYIAYGMATALRETNRTMQPIDEMGGNAYFTSLYDIEGRNPSLARRLGNVNPGDGALFHGRGLVQLTGRDNYRRATVKLRAMGLLAASDDMETTPDLAKLPTVATGVLWAGMIEGWFTGKCLSDYCDASPADYIEARRIINGEDHAEEIAGYAHSFERALRLAD